MSEPVLLILLVINLLLLLYLAWRQHDKPSNSSDWQAVQHSLEQHQQSLMNNFYQNTRMLQTQLQQNRQTLDNQLTATQKYLQQTAHQLGELSQLGSAIKQLQQLLISPKLRGGLGEQLLQDMLEEIIPKHLLHYQYQFASGETVDAAIETDAGLIVIDAKFPLPDQSKNSAGQIKQKLKKHLHEIARKYIKPEEGSLNFALMYLPAESVYHQLINSAELIKLSHKLRVYPVSPSTLYSHLQIILLSYQGQQLQSRTRQLIKTINQLQNHTQLWQTRWQVFKNHWQNAGKKLQEVDQSQQQILQDIDQLNQLDDKQLRSLET